MLDSVKDYYGQVLTSSDDLKTNACCTAGAPEPHIREILTLIHDEVLGRYYGCGLVAPQALEGLDILDLGSGAGRDAYTLAALAGEQGSVTGVDMTEEQLEVARRHIEYHREAFGFSRANTEFQQGYLEDLAAVGLKDEAFDVIVSNCVINLCADKAAVLREAWRVLKPGGELYFSDVYADRRIPPALAEDPVLYGECLSGALYWNDFIQLAKQAGFADPRVVDSDPLLVEDAELAAKLGNIRFNSVTCRLFKAEGLEAEQEDYGQAVRYLGTVAEQPERFVLDRDHHLARDRVTPVSGNTSRMLKSSRFADHFEFIGEGSTHYGAFQPDAAAAAPAPEARSGGCC